MNSITQDFIHSFSAYYRGLKLYPPQHPSCLSLGERYWASMQNVLHLQQRIKIGSIDDILFINDQLCDEANPAARSILAILRLLETEGLEILRFIKKEQALTFVVLLYSGELNGANFETVLRSHGIDTIRKLTSSEHNGTDSVRKAYSDTIQIVAETCSMIENRQIPSSAKLFGAAKNITNELSRAPYAFLALTMIKDYDDYTYCHSVNVSILAVAIGQACNLSHDELQILGVGALMHDLGKLYIDPEIIKKPGPLSKSEFEAIKKHPELGAEIATHMDSICPQIIDTIQGHHLNFDRSGYPQINLNQASKTFVDITSVADTYDAMTTLRAYRRPSSPHLAVQRMQQVSGSQLNPEYVAALTRVLGNYPVGTLVRLISNEIGLIVDGNIEDMEQGTIRILYDSHGNRIDTPLIQQLDNKNASIAGEADPILHNININELL